MKLEAVMTDETVLSTDERLIAEGEAAVDNYNHSREQARKQIIPMARGLLAARRRYPANQDFGEWLHTSAYRELDEHDRAALIRIGENEAAVIEYIRTTRLTSPRSIWEAISKLSAFWRFSKTTEQESSPTESRGNVPPSPANVDIATPASAEKPEKVGERHPFVGQPRASEVAAIYQHGKTRWTIGKLLHKRGGNDVWALILQAIDIGILQSTSLNTETPTSRVLFPQAPLEFTRALSLAKESDRVKIRDEIMPVVERCREEIIAAPERLPTVLQREKTAEIERAKAEARGRKLEIALRGLAPGENEVVLFGKYFWPIIDIDDPEQRYDFGQLQAAAWFFEEALRAVRSGPDNSPKSCGIKIRFMLKPLQRLFDAIPASNPARARWRQTYGLIGELTRLLEKSPEKEDSNRMPLLPDEPS